MKFTPEHFDGYNEHCQTIKEIKEFIGDREFTFEELSSKFKIVTVVSFFKYLKEEYQEQFLNESGKEHIKYHFDEIDDLIRDLKSMKSSAKYEKDKYENLYKVVAPYQNADENLIKDLVMFRHQEEVRNARSQVINTLRYVFDESYQAQSYLTTNNVMYRTLSVLLEVANFREDDFAEIEKQFNFEYWGLNSREQFYATAIIFRNRSAWKSIEKHLNRKPFLLNGKRIYEGAKWEAHQDNRRIFYRCTGWNSDGKVKFLTDTSCTTEKQKRYSKTNEEFKDFFKEIKIIF